MAFKYVKSTFLKTLAFTMLCFLTLNAQAQDEIENVKPKGLFGSVEFKLGNINVLKKWKDVLDKVQKEQSYFQSCDQSLQSCKNQGLSAWRNFISEAKFKPKKELLKDVNAFINQWPYIEDAKNWKKSDYWASPIEFLDKSGDCEDYAIIKYVTLKELGFDPKKMRIVVVMDKLRLLNHAILVVYENNSQALVLDSLFDAVLPQERVLQYTPHYSVNEYARWAHVMPIQDEGKED
ncbi:MAG: hypothetical protein CMF61_08355 [Magnetococcales bacterium]|nr:hypothetical protein [Magnetococcales bacterium]